MFSWIKPKIKQWGWLWAILFLAPFFLNPDPTGNNPNAIRDESYFLTSALLALQHATLPGWLSSSASAYYGGVQAYVVTLALGACLVGLLARFQSVALVEGFVATHTGWLLHVSRLVNGVAVLCVFGCLFRFVQRHPLGRALRLPLALGLALLLGNSLFAGMLHTGKVWVFQILFDLGAMSVVFLCDEARRRGLTFCSRTQELNALLWLSFLAAVQNLTGALTGLWIVYAVLLGHVTWPEIWQRIKKYLWIWLLLLVTQVSIIYHGIEIFRSGSFSITNLSASQFESSAHAIDLGQRFIWPLKILFFSQPLLAVLLVVSLSGFFFQRWRRERLFGLAWIHCLIVYACYYGLFGFGSFPRYVLPLSIAGTFVIVCSSRTWNRRVIRMVAALAVVCALIVLGKTVAIFWGTSSEQQVVERFAQAATSTTMLVRASAITFPLNQASLAALDARHRSFGRYAFLLAHPQAVDRFVSYPAHVVLLPGATSTAGASVWTQGCVWDVSDACTDVIHASSTDWVVNPQACSMHDALPEEVTTWPDLLGSRMFGRAYRVRLLRSC